MKLIGEKVILRPMKVADAEHFVEWFRDPGVNKFLSRRKLDLKEERVWIRSIPKRKNELHLAVDAKEGIHIGNVGFSVINRRDGYAVFGIMIGDKRYWDHGYGTEAMKLIVDYGFRRLKLHRIELDVYDYNGRGIHVYRRLGFKVEGRKREHIRWGGRYHDLVQMGILRDQWLGKKRSR